MWALFPGNAGFLPAQRSMRVKVRKGCMSPQNMRDYSYDRRKQIGKCIEPVVYFFPDKCSAPFL